VIKHYQRGKGLKRAGEVCCKGRMAGGRGLNHTSVHAGEEVAREKKGKSGVRGNYFKPFQGKGKT